MVITLGQLQITMASVTCLDSTNFGPDPQTVRKKRFYPLLKSRMQLKQVDKILFHGYFFSIATNLAKFPHITTIIA